MTRSRHVTGASQLRRLRNEGACPLRFEKWKSPGRKMLIPLFAPRYIEGYAEMGKVSKRPWTYKGIRKHAWVYRYMAQGRRRQKTFGRKKDADAFARQKEGEIARGEVARASVAIGEAAEQYLRFQELRMRDGVIGRGRYELVKRHMNLYVKPFLGKMRFDEIHPRDVERWLKIIDERHLAPGTIVDIRASMRLLERYAKRQGYVGATVIAETFAEHGTPKVLPIRTFSAAEVSKILEAAAVREPFVATRGQDWAECFVHLATFCGLRFGEISALTHDICLS